MKVIRQIREPWLLLFCLVGCFINYIAYKPGFLSPDSIDQFGQSLTGKYEDWHRPVMAWLWHWFDKVHQGPQLMLLFQLGCLWCSAYLLATISKNTIWRIAVCCITLAPFVQNFAGYIIKDSQMALSWLFAFVIMLHAFMLRQRMCIWEIVGSLH